MASTSGSGTSAAAAPALARPLGELLIAMASGSERERENAWAECYDRYRDLVWTRVFYVIRGISWVREPREVAEDVTSDVFVGLPDAAKQYRETGRAEQWLKHLAVRAALRARERLTGDWNKGRRPSDSRAPARRYLSFEDEADMIVRDLDGIETEELLELERRIAAMRSSADQRMNRWAEFLDLYRAGYGFLEIGERLGLSEGTARNWLVEIRKHLAAAPAPK